MIRRVYEVIMVIAIAGATHAQEMVIQSFDSTGELTWSNPASGTWRYRVEWAANPGGPWMSTWDHLSDIVTSNSSCTVFVPMWYRVVASPVGRYLIIAADRYTQSPSLSRFASFRGEDFDVQLVAGSSVGSTAGAFRDYVRGAEPAYVLLVGDYGDFPAYVIEYPGGTIESYNYYVASSLSGHPNPDIPLGLFFVQNETELSNIVHKTIYTERNISALPRKYYAHAGSAEALWPWPVEFNEEILTEMNSKYFEPDGYDFELATANDATPNDVWTDINMINAGAGFVIYHGHGTINKWSFGLGVGGLPQLTNSVYPFVISAACLTGSFSGSVGDVTNDCFATSMVASPNGAVAFIGAYNKSGRGQNPLLEGLCEAIHDSEINRLGNALIHGFANRKLPGTVTNYYPYVDEIERIRSAWQFHLFGDPAIRLPERAER